MLAPNPTHRPSSLSIYIYIYFFLLLYIYRGKNGGFLRVSDVTGFLKISKVRYKMPINGGFLPFFPVTWVKMQASLSFSIGRGRGNVRQPISFNPKRARRSWSPDKKRGEPKPSPVGRSGGRSAVGAETVIVPHIVGVNERQAVRLVRVPNAGPIVVLHAQLDCQGLGGVSVVLRAA